MASAKMLRLGDRSCKDALNEGSHEEACNGKCVHDIQVVKMYGDDIEGRIDCDDAKSVQ